MILKKNILFFSPFQTIWQHAFHERKFSEILESTKYFQITYLGCKGIFGSFCLSMSTFGLTSNSDISQKKKICQSCQKMSACTWNTNNKLYIDDYINEDDKKEVTNLVSELKNENIQEFNYHGIPIGKIAPYELLLNNKLSSIEKLSTEIWADYLAAVTNCLYTVIALEKFFEENKIDRILLYNANYGINHTVKLVSQKLNIPTINLHYSLEFNRFGEYFFLTEEMPYNHLNKRKEFFEINSANLNIQFSDSKRIFEHISYLFEAKNFWVYSEKKLGKSEYVRDTFNINDNSPIALMSLSSMDELFGLEFSIAGKQYINNSNILFKDQFQWIQSTIEYFSKNPEWKLIIRIHPREFPNRRDSITSEVGKKYLEILSKLPTNIFLNHPDQKVSIYDIMSIINVHLTSWSSVGLESALMGIPTISITENITLYPNKYINHYPRSINEYYSLISKFMNKEIVRSFEYYAKARDWLLFDFIQTTIEIKSNSGLKQIPSLLKRVLYKFKIIGFNKLYDYKKYSKKATISEEETKILKEYFTTLTPVYELKNMTLRMSKDTYHEKNTSESEILKNFGIIFNSD